jgi:hypothetical protein
MRDELSPLTCSAEELYAVVSSHNRTWLTLALSNPAIHENHVLALLRNPSITGDVVRLIEERYEWASSYKIQLGILNCPKTPYPVAIKTLEMMFWPDLVKIAANYRLSPKLRRAAENRLRDKTAELTLGEKLSLARTAPRAGIAFLKAEKDPRVMEALLRNPGLIEDDILVIANNELTPKEVLRTIATDYKWKVRYSIRLALVRNPQTPLSAALPILSKLRKSDLKALTKLPDVSELVRRAAERVLEEDPSTRPKES